MPINSEHLASLTDADVIDQNGDKVGSVGQIYLDDATGQPAWVSVKSGLFGLRESFVPLNDANVAGGNIQVPYTKDYVKDAPRVDAEDHLDDSQQSTLFSYYGVERGAAAGAPDSAGAPDRTATFGSDEVAEEMTHSRTEGIPTAAPSANDGAVTTEYTTPGVDDATSGAGVGDSGSDLGSGSLSEPAAASAAGAVESGRATDTDSAVGDAQPGVFRQSTAAGDSDSSAEQDPAAPTSQPWAMPTSDHAYEEATDTSRSGYAPDQPAAHSSAYEDHSASVGTSAADAGDADQFGTVEPVTTDSAPDAGSTTGDAGAFAGPGAAAAAGGAAEGYAADVSTTAYETPGAETGDPITGSTPGAAFAADVEQPADGLTLPDDTASDSEFAAEETTLAAGTDAGLGDTGEPGDTGGPEIFGPEGYRPDRDGTEMSDEERERLNRARGAL